MHKLLDIFDDLLAPTHEECGIMLGKLSVLTDFALDSFQLVCDGELEASQKKQAAELAHLYDGSDSRRSLFFLRRELTLIFFRGNFMNGTNSIKLFIQDDLLDLKSIILKIPHLRNSLQVNVVSRGTA